MKKCNVELIRDETKNPPAINCISYLKSNNCAFEIARPTKKPLGVYVARCSAFTYVAFSKFCHVKSLTPKSNLINKKEFSYFYFIL